MLVIKLIRRKIVLSADEKWKDRCVINYRKVIVNPYYAFAKIYFTFCLTYGVLSKSIMFICDMIYIILPCY